MKVRTGNFESGGRTFQVPPGAPLPDSIDSLRDRAQRDRQVLPQLISASLPAKGPSGRQGGPTAGTVAALPSPLGEWVKSERLNDGSGIRQGRL